MQYLNHIDNNKLNNNNFFVNCQFKKPTGFLPKRRGDQRRPQEPVGNTVSSKRSHDGIIPQRPQKHILQSQGGLFNIKLIKDLVD